MSATGAAAGLVNLRGWKPPGTAIRLRQGSVDSDSKRTEASMKSDTAAVVDVDQLYRRYAPMVLRRIRRFYDGPEAEEVLHEVFLRAIEKLDSFRHDASPVTWLYRLTTNYCLNRLRNNSRRAALLEREGPELQKRQVQSAAQEGSIFLRQLWKLLDPELVQVGTYYYIDGMTHDEIAQVLGVSPRTVGYRLKKLETRARDAATQAYVPEPGKDGGKWD